MYHGSIQAPYLASMVGGTKSVPHFVLACPSNIKRPNRWRLAILSIDCEWSVTFFVTHVVSQMIEKSVENTAFHTYESTRWHSHTSPLTWMRLVDRLRTVVLVEKGLLGCGLFLKDSMELLCAALAAASRLSRDCRVTAGSCEIEEVRKKSKRTVNSSL